MNRARFIAALVLAASLAACKPKSATQVADKFVDLYFVVIDQRSALELTSGLAHQKLEEELNLVETVRKTYNQDQAKPSIFYQRRFAREMGDNARFGYDLTIKQGRDETDRNALISAERIGGKWTVGNFMVREGHLPVAPPH